LQTDKFFLFLAMTTDKLCLDCGTLVHGRTDKKFCNDLCRNNYNNQRNSDSSVAMRSVNAILRRNRQILEKLTPVGKTRTSRKRLISSGFNFEYHTRILQTSSGKIYFFCYEYGYLALDNEEYLLVKQDNE